MNREKNLESILAISTGLILLWFIYEIRALLLVAFTLGIVGLFFNTISGWINWLWYKIAEIMGLFIPKILLSLVFFLILTPIAWLYRSIKGDGLQLRKQNKGSYWVERQHKFTGKDLENIW